MYENGNLLVKANCGNTCHLIYLTALCAMQLFKWTHSMYLTCGTRKFIILQVDQISYQVYIFWYSTLLQKPIKLPQAAYRSGANMCCKLLTSLASKLVYSFGLTFNYLHRRGKHIRWRKFAGTNITHVSYDKVW